MPTYPCEPLELRQVGFGSFMRDCTALHDRGDVLKFVKCALAGRARSDEDMDVDDAPPTQRLVMNPRAHYASWDEIDGFELELKRGVRRIEGGTQTLPFSKPLRFQIANPMGMQNELFGWKVEVSEGVMEARPAMSCRNN